MCVECGLGNWNEQWWLSESKKKMETTLLDAPDSSFLWKETHTSFNLPKKVPTKSNAPYKTIQSPKSVCEKIMKLYGFYRWTGRWNEFLCSLQSHLFFIIILGCCWVFFTPAIFWFPPPRFGLFVVGREAISFAFVDCQSISIAKVATEDGSGFGGDCRGSR